MAKWLKNVVQRTRTCMEVNFDQPNNHRAKWLKNVGQQTHTCVEVNFDQPHNHMAKWLKNVVKLTYTCMEVYDDQPTRQTQGKLTKECCTTHTYYMHWSLYLYFVKYTNFITKKTTTHYLGIFCRWHLLSWVAAVWLFQSHISNVVQYEGRQHLFILS